MKIVNLTTDEVINVKTFTFSGGEVNVKIENPSLINEGDNIQITQHIHNSNDTMELLLVTNALRQLFVGDIEVVIPYVPYARQDRVMVEGEALSIKVFAEIINAQNYKKVTILDPHSSVTPALINNVYIVDNTKFVLDCFEMLHERMKYFNGKENIFLVSPDAGALKKVEKCAKKLIEEKLIDNNPIIIGTKTRDVTNGKILNSSINVEKIPANNVCVIIDDICDGGRTFIELAKVLRNAGAERICLFVTHGIFSAGFKPIFEEIDVIATTNSFKDVDDADLECMNEFQNRNFRFIEKAVEECI